MASKETIEYSCDCCEKPIKEDPDKLVTMLCHLTLTSVGSSQGETIELPTSDWDLCEGCMKRFGSYMRRGAPKIDWSKGTVDVGD